MKIRKNYLTLIFLAFIAIAACKNNSKQSELLKLGIHTIIVQEIVHTSQYSYIRYKEEGNPNVKETDTLWCAVTRSESKIGDTLYYKGGFPMKDFLSKELNRSFKEVLFIDDLSTSSDFVKKEIAEVPSHQQMASSDSSTGKPVTAKIEMKIDPVAGGVTIADLFAKKANFKGKTVKIKGKVVKFSPDIMSKNWIHIQDGTEFDGKYDLTVTSDITVKLGDIIVIEGKIALDKDLGYSYFYEVLMEEAKIVK
ncbi:MAG: hypothetical protein ACOYO1_11015 [Bacteroidales bacterium]